MARFLLKSALVPLLTVKLLETSKIHLVFHVSLLKQHQGPLPNIPDSLPPMSSDNHLVVEPLQVLEWKWNNANVSPIKLALVQWIGLAPKDTSWEHWDNVRVSYNLKDKVLLLDGVMIALVSWPLTDQGGPPGGQHTSAITHKGQL